jgi:hypothetical protein
MLYFLVDRCNKCDPVNAICNRGQCACKTGFVGNGYQCLPEKIVSSKKGTVLFIGTKRQRLLM